MNVRALHNFIIVRPDQDEEKSIGGIVLTSTEKNNTGEVLAAGPGEIDDNGNLHEMIVNVGDKVLYGKASSNNFVTIDDEELLLLTDKEIFGVVEKAE